MKVTWEAADIRPGRRVGKEARAEVWMIGYDPRVPAGDNAPGQRYGLVSLNDGMWQAVGTSKELAEYLNNTGEMPLELLPGKPN